MERLHVAAAVRVDRSIVVQASDLLERVDRHQHLANVRLLSVSEPSENEAHHQRRQQRLYYIENTTLAGHAPFALLGHRRFNSASFFLTELQFKKLGGPLLSGCPVLATSHPQLENY
jgi:hypothetical protein